MTQGSITRVGVCFYRQRIYNSVPVMPLARTFFDFTVGEQPLGRVVVSYIKLFHFQAMLISSSNYIQMCKSWMTSLTRPHLTDQQSPKDSREVSLYDH